MEYHLNFLMIHLMNIQSLMDKLNKDVSFQHQQTSLEDKKNSYFHSVWYNDDIIMGLNFFFQLHIL